MVICLIKKQMLRDYQKILEQQILKLNYRSFTQVVILGSSTFVPFMQLKARHCFCEDTRNFRYSNILYYEYDTKTKN